MNEDFEDPWLFIKKNFSPMNIIKNTFSLSLKNKS